jgi:uncharacterized membrane protein
MLLKFRRIVLVILVMFAVLLAGVQVNAQSAASAPVVYAVLFYSPTCPHCHEVIQNHVPNWEAEFGDSLILLFVDVTQQGGSMLAYATCDALGVESCGSVPMLVMGEVVMVGSQEIPARTPGLIRDGLANGGIDLPPVPELRQAYAEFVALDEAEAQAAAEASTPETVTTSESVETTTWLDKLKRDPEGNVVAIVTLVGLILSLGIGLWFGPKDMFEEEGRLYSVAVIILIGAGIVLAASLLVKSGDTPAMIASGGMLILLLWAGISFGMGQLTDWLVPLVATAGLLVVVYLMRVEVADTGISCGLIGDCRTVQQSQYAELFGVLPVGVLGAVAYGVILTLWAVSRFWVKSTINVEYAQAGLLLSALAGVAFSIYLTFLEPFVIGATCMWCISSAVIMMLLLWLVAPAGWGALRSIRQPDREPGQAVSSVS